MSFDFQRFTKNALKLGDLKAVEVFDSIRKQEESGRSLSERQLKFLMTLALRNSDAAVEASEEFALRMEADYDFREDARIIANYYKKQVQYFAMASTAELILKYLKGESTLLPTYSEYKRIRDNKYAEKVLKSAKTPPIWNAGGLVCIRANARNVRYNGMGTAGQFYHRYHNPTAPKLTEVTCMIVAVDSRPITDALQYHPKQGGTRWYKLMPLGMTVTVEVMERDLKKTKKLS